MFVKKLIERNISKIYIYFFNIRFILKFFCFCELYNMSQVNKINIFLIQKFFLLKKIAYFYKFNFFAIFIIFNRSDNTRKKIATIINNKIVE